MSLNTQVAFDQKLLFQSTSHKCVVEVSHHLFSLATQTSNNTAFALESLGPITYRIKASTVQMHHAQQS